jgi:3-methyladenine DNA glycosylase AlkD
LSRELDDAPPKVVRDFAFALTERDCGFDRFIAAETIASHQQTFTRLTRNDVLRLGRGMDSWGDVDVFACYVGGPAWRIGRVTDAEVLRWARSDDRWWRRTAVVGTVPLNSRARGGTGDAPRTLMLSREVVTDRDPMIVKALSWALRELAKVDAEPVRRFLSTHEAELAPLVRREVQTKLSTGRKAAPRKLP